MRTQELFNFIYERHNIWLYRQAGAPKPWTADPILQKFRFCNVYRELDKVTLWINHNWRTPYKQNTQFKDLWFALVIARLFNYPDFLQEVGYPKPEGKAITPYLGRLWEIADKRKKEGKKNFNPAYIVSTNGRAMDKVDYLIFHVLLPMWNIRENVRPKENEELRAFYNRLQGCMGMGTFMAAQVVADIKYVPMYLDAKDWYTFAASGPGSRRGLNRVYGHFVDNPWREIVWHEKLIALLEDIKPLIKKALMPELHAQDLQNCLCEFDKYERVRLGEGTPKQRYNGVIND